MRQKQLWMEFWMSMGTEFLFGVMMMIQPFMQCGLGGGSSQCSSQFNSFGFFITVTNDVAKFINLAKSFHPLDLHMGRG